MTIALDEITVIVPTRNEVDNMPAFLGSLPAEVHLIIVDDSTDATPDLIEALRTENTTVLRRAANVTEARQIGGEAAETDWLLFTDADIIFDAPYFRRVAPYDRYDVVYGPKLSRDAYAAYYRRMARGQAVMDRLGIPAASGSNLLISRRAFEGCGGYDLSLTCNEDSEIAWRIARRGYAVHYAPDLVVYARDHRRLKRGTMRKTIHSVARCTLLYTGLMPRRWRVGDWGYWQSTDRERRER